MDPTLPREPPTPPEQPLVNGVMEHLSARMGGLYGLPELHVLIQDVVNGTLKSLKGIVETQVTRTLEAEQFALVKDMVTRLLTEEVLRVTELSAQALMRREMANVEINQKRLLDSVSATETEVQRRLDAAGAEQRRLEGDLGQKAAEQEALRSRVDELGRGLQRVETALAEAAGTAGRVDSLQAAARAQEGQTQELHGKISQLEQRCAERFTAKSALEDLKKEVQVLAKRQEERGEAWLSAALKPHALREELRQGLEELGARLGAETQRSHQAMRENLDDVHYAASQTGRSLDEAWASHRELQGVCETERAARVALEERLHEEVAQVRRDCASVVFMDTSLGTHKQELSQLTAAIAEARAASEAGRLELHDAVGGVREQLQRSIEAIHAQEADVKQLQLSISRLDEGQAKIHDGFADEKLRAQSIMNQQENNRQELRFLGEQVAGLAALSTAAGELQQRAEGHEQSLAALGGQVVQWKDAVAAQQGLRRDAAQLREGLDSLRETVRKLQEEQAAGIVQLRDLHTRWLVPKA